METLIEKTEPKLARVVLKPRKVRPFFGRHPWVLDSAIQKIEGEPADGDVVDLLTDRGQWIARGIFNTNSRIRVRLYTWQADEAIDADFWRRRLQTAGRLRTLLGYDDPNGAARLVSSEADGLGGLIVERYGEHLVIQVTALAIAERLEEIVPLIIEQWRPASISLRTERDMNKAEGMHLEEGVLWGTRLDGPVFISEHGVRYGVDLSSGQKTGFFLDQRENRRAAAGYFAGRRVLDMFCYTGAFSLAASVVGQAKEVQGVDSSQKAVMLAQANAQLNSVANVQFQVADVFQHLENLGASEERFGAIVLDPPKFARGRQAVPEALRAYHHVNRLAVKLLERDGILVTCSCSGHVTRDDFLFMLSDVAQRTGREIQVLEQRGAAPDHPVSASCLESDYLKCMICRVV
jgi:23S rRNA (cytosine1962-C5)-methyltransferase